MPNITIPTCTIPTRIQARQARQAYENTSTPNKTASIFTVRLNYGLTNNLVIFHLNLRFKML